MWLRKQLPNFQTVTAGAKNSCYIPDGVKLHKITLELGDDNGLQLPTGGLLGNIGVFAVNAYQRVCSAVYLAQLNSLRGAAYAIKTSGTPGTAGFRTFLSIFFAQPWIQPREIGKLYGWALVPGTGFRLDVDIVAGVTNPILRGWMYYSPLSSDDKELGLIEKWFQTPLQVSGASNEHVKIPGVKDLVQSLHLFPFDGNYVANATVKRGPGATLVDEITHLQNQANLIEQGLQPDTSPAPRYDLMFDDEDPRDPGLPAAAGGELTVKTVYNAAASGNMDVVSVVLGKPE